jgi:hypothetical protein
MEENNEVDGYRMLLEGYKEEMEAAESAEQQQAIKKNFQDANKECK